MTSPAPARPRATSRSGRSEAAAPAAATTSDDTVTVDFDVAEFEHASDLLPIGIGERDREIINCPVCGRPLLARTFRCPGCGTRLLLGVHLRRAGAFIAAGTAFGIVVAALGGAFAGSFAPLQTPPDQAAVSTRATPGPTPSIAVPRETPTATPTAAPSVPPGAPAFAAAALNQLAGVNADMENGATELRALVQSTPTDAAAIARALRGLAGGAAAGDSIAPRLAEWPIGADVSYQLTILYGDVTATARLGLRNSLANPAAYRETANDMLAILAGLEPIDDQIATIAWASGVPLPD